MKKFISLFIITVLLFLGERGRAEERKTSILIPVSINKQSSGNIQSEIRNVAGRNVISLQAAPLIDLLQKAGKKAPAELLEKRQDRVSLDELTSMGFYCNYDEEKVEIQISPPIDPDKPDLLQISTGQEFFRDGEKIKPVPVSGYVNTSATVGFRRDQKGATYGDDASARFDGVFNASGYVLEASGTVHTESSFQRDDVRVTKEVNWLNGMRVSAGDLFYPVVGYQNYRKMGGLSAYTIRDQKQGFLGNRVSDKQIEVRQPSTLTFFVNEQPVATRKVLPGLYDVSDIPMATGVNHIRVLVEADGTGQREEISFDDFFSDYGIKKGQRDFAVAVGEKSYDVDGVRNYDDNKKTFMINHRYDYSNRFSWSQYFQGDTDAQIVGFIEAFHAPGGYVQIDSAASNFTGHGGIASRVGYFKSSPDQFSLLSGDKYNLNFERKFSGFSTLDFGPQDGQTSLNLAYTFPTFKKMSLGIGASYGKIDSSVGDTYSYSGNLSRAMGDFYVTANASQRYAPGTPSELTVGLSLNWSPSERSYYLNTQYSEHSQSSTHLAMNTTRDQDVKGSITQSTGLQSLVTQSQITGTTNRNEMTFSADRTESRFDHSYLEHFSFNTRFAVAFAGGKIAIGRPISDSFFLTDSKHESRDYKLETWGRHAETGPMGEALLGFNNYQNNSVHVSSGDEFGHTFDNSGVYTVENSWRNGYLLKLKSNITPLVIHLTAPDLSDLKNSVMHLVNSESGENTDFFVSSDGEVFLEGIEEGSYEFYVGQYSGQFDLNRTGGHKYLDLRPAQ